MTDEATNTSTKEVPHVEAVMRGDLALIAHNANVDHHEAIRRYNEHAAKVRQMLEDEQAELSMLFEAADTARVALSDALGEVLRNIDNESTAIDPDSFPELERLREIVDDYTMEIDDMDDPEISIEIESFPENDVELLQRTLLRLKDIR